MRNRGRKPQHAPALALAGLLGLAPARAAAGAAGGDPFDFLLLDANARAVGLAGAYTAQAVDANALLYNPAGLARLASHEATFMHNSHALGLTQDYVAYAGPRGWGVNLSYLDFGDVQKTTLADPSGASLGTTGLTDLAVGAGYGWSPGDSLSLGLGAKYLRESIDAYSVNAYALDAGLLYSSLRLPDLRLGLAAQNIGPTVRFQSARESLPLNLRVGAAYDAVFNQKEHSFSLDVSKTKTGRMLVAAGVEAKLIGGMPLRLGYGTRNEAGPGITAGMGWDYRSFTFDYAFEPFGALGFSHRISLTARWAAGARSRPARKKGARARDPGDPFDIASEFIELGMLEAAEEELDALHARIGSDDALLVRYHERKGAVAFQRAANREAVEEYQKALKIAIQHSLGGWATADAYAGIGRVLAREGDYERALKFMLKAVEAGPSPKAEKRMRDEIREIQRRGRPLGSE